MAISHEKTRREHPDFCINHAFWDQEYTPSLACIILLDCSILEIKSMIGPLHVTLKLHHGEHLENVVFRAG